MTCKRKLRSYLSLVESYLEANSKQRKRAIRKMNLRTMNSLCECVLNILVNKKLTSTKQKILLQKYLAPFNNELYDLVCCKMCLKERKNLCIYLHNCVALALKLLYPSLLRSIL